MDPTPDLLTIEEAARVLRIGRTKAYAMGQEYRTTNARSGMKVIEVGGQLRVPRAWLEDKLGAPVLSIPSVLGSSNGNGIEDKPERLARHRTANARAHTVTSPTPTRRRQPRKRARINDNQLTLPFS